MWPERLCHTRVSGGKELACNLRREGATCQGGCEMDKKSLRTHNRRKAERIRDARNQDAERPQLGIAMAEAYLTAHDLARSQTWSQMPVRFLRLKSSKRS